eukprot:gene12494-12628_t
MIEAFESGAAGVLASMGSRDSESVQAPASLQSPGVADRVQALEYSLNISESGASSSAAAAGDDDDHPRGSLQGQRSLPHQFGISRVGSSSGGTEPRRSSSIGAAGGFSFGRGRSATGQASSTDIGEVQEVPHIPGVAYTMLSSADPADEAASEHHAVDSVRDEPTQAGSPRKLLRLQQQKKARQYKGHLRADGLGGTFGVPSLAPDSSAGSVAAVGPTALKGPVLVAAALQVASVTPRKVWVMQAQVLEVAAGLGVLVEMTVDGVGVVGIMASQAKMVMMRIPTKGKMKKGGAAGPGQPPVFRPVTEVAGSSSRALPAAPIAPWGERVTRRGFRLSDSGTPRSTGPGTLQVPENTGLSKGSSGSSSGSSLHVPTSATTTVGPITPSPTAFWGTETGMPSPALHGQLQGPAGGVPPAWGAPPSQIDIEMPYPDDQPDPQGGPGQDCSTWFGSSERIARYQELYRDIYAKAVQLPPSAISVGNIDCEGTTVYSQAGASGSRSNGRRLAATISNIGTDFTVQAPADPAEQARITKAVQSVSPDALRNALAEFFGASVDVISSRQQTQQPQGPAAALPSNMSIPSVAPPPIEQPAPPAPLPVPSPGPKLPSRMLMPPPPPARTAQEAAATQTKGKQTAPKLPAVGNVSVELEPQPPRLGIMPVRPANTTMQPPAGQVLESPPDAPPPLDLPAAVGIIPVENRTAEARNTTAEPAGGQPVLEIKPKPAGTDGKQQPQPPSPSVQQLQPPEPAMQGKNKTAMDTSKSPTQPPGVGKSPPPPLPLVDRKPPAPAPAPAPAPPPPPAPAVIRPRFWVSWGSAEACEEQPTGSNSRPDNMGRLWGWQDGQSCAFRTATQQPVFTTWYTASSCAGTPTASNSVSDSVGRRWGYQQGRSCAFRAADGAASLQLPADQQQPTWQDASACPGYPTAANSVADSQGRRWGWFFGRSCAYRRGNQQLEQRGPSSWQIAPTCSAAPDSSNSIADSQQQLWGYQNGASCAFRGSDGSPLKLQSQQVNWWDAPSCSFLPGTGNYISDSQGQLWGWQNDMSCAFRSIAGTEMQLWSFAPACEGPVTASNSVRDSQGMLWGFQQGRSCAFRGSSSTESTQATDWQRAVSCAGNPAPDDSVYDANGRLWGWQQDQSCIFRGSYQYMPMQIQWQDAPTCSMARTSSNTVVDSSGHPWG